MATFTGTSGDDNLTGTSGDDTFQLYQGGNDTASGLAGTDIFNFGATFTAADSIDGGTGTDYLRLNGDYSAGVTFGAATMTNVEVIQLTAGFNYNLTTDDANVAAGQSLTVDAHNLGAGNGLTFNGSNESDGRFIVEGGAGNDTVTGGLGADTFNLTFGGSDTANGGDGDDTFLMGATFTAADQIDGGAGNDTVQLSGDYSTQVVLAPTTLENVETLKLISGFSYNIATADANVAPGQTLTVDGSALGTNNTLKWNGFPESNGSFDLIGGAGNDILEGGNGPGDTFDISHGGEDQVLAGSGNDNILAGAAYDRLDQINGGDGNDLLVLNGDYSSPLALEGTTLLSVETIRFTAGHDYSIVSNNANVTAGTTLTVDASALGAGDSATFDGHEETNGGFIFDGGAGTNIFTGGSGADTFNIIDTGANVLKGGANADVFILTGGISATDQIDGGTGADTVDIDGNITVVFNATTVVNVEKLGLGPTGTGTQSITTADATVAAGATLVIDATGVATGGTEIFNGAAETDGSFIYDGGFGTNTVTGGAQADTFRLDSIATNNVTGGGGGDHIQDTGGVKGHTTYIYNAVSDSTSTGYDTITGLVTSNFVFHVSPIGAVTGIDTTVSSGALSTATFDSDLAAAIGAGQLAAHHAVEFTATSGTLAGNTFLVIDENGTAGYQAGADLVIDIGTNHPTLTLAEFS